MKKITYRKIQTVLFGIMGVLVAGLLLHLWLTPNSAEFNGREAAGYTVAENVDYQTLTDSAAPTGVVREFRFRLSECLTYDSSLIFRFSHQYAEVYLDGELVYSLKSAEEIKPVRTVGVNWAMIPLYREDGGKEVRVVLTPVYENYQTQNITFRIGSKYAVCMEQFKKSLPEMVLSLIDIFTGLILLCVAFYFSGKREEGSGFYALSLLAISLGLWNFTQTDFVPLLFEGRTTFVYYVSLTMLMVSVLPLIRSVKATSGRGRKTRELWCLVCAGVNIVLLLLQFTGVCDLRELLKLVHGMIAVSSVVLILNSVAGVRKRKNKIEGVWLLGAGALIDMFLYYGKGYSMGLLFVLIAILCYVLLEGVEMFVAYTRQKQMLEEKDTQLTLSRITTMMSQIRSHFVFNILNAISGMCKYDPEKADDTVVRFARYLRNNIDIMEDDKPVLFSTELAHLEDYVVLEQVRFGDKIEFYADVQTERFMIPPLILQPVVENAIKHGLTQKETGGTVILRTREEGENIVITVEDDGVGFELSELEKERSVGLKNIRYRLRHLAGGTLEIESQVGVGTKVTITIPKKEAAICT